MEYCKFKSIVERVKNENLEPRSCLMSSETRENINLDGWGIQTKDKSSFVANILNLDIGTTERLDENIIMFYNKAIQQPNDITFPPAYLNRCCPPIATYDVTEDSLSVEEPTEETCSTCKGKGKYVGFNKVEDPCQDCNGKGYV